MITCLKISKSNGYSHTSFLGTTASHKADTWLFYKHTIDLLSASPESFNQNRSLDRERVVPVVDVVKVVL